MIIEGGVFEKIEIGDKSLIYNPIFDEVHNKNAVFYDMEQYLSIKRSLKTIIPPLSIPIPIQVSNLPSIPISLTPFQVYKFRLNSFQVAVAEKQKTNSLKNINFKIQSLPVYSNSQRIITPLQVERYKRRLIGSYSSYYYNKFELDKVKDFNSRSKKRFINENMNMTHKKAILIKSLKIPGKATHFLSLSSNKRKPDKDIFKFNVRI